MLTYSDVQTFLTEGLVGLHYGELGSTEMPVIDPGPASLPALQKLSPGSIVFATVGNGAGLTLESTYDQVFITIRAIGLQRDYAGAEKLAQDIDRMFLEVGDSRLLGTTRVLYVTRAGGGPQLIDYDSADRYHFQTTYVVPAMTGI
jgi:hypothetical protein